MAYIFPRALISLTRLSVWIPVGSGIVFPKAFPLCLALALEVGQPCPVAMPHPSVACSSSSCPPTTAQRQDSLLQQCVLMWRDLLLKSRATSDTASYLIFCRAKNWNKWHHVRCNIFAENVNSQKLCSCMFFFCNYWRFSGLMYIMQKRG